MERFLRLNEVAIDGTKFLNGFDNLDGVGVGGNNGGIVSIPGIEEILR